MHADRQNFLLSKIRTFAHAIHVILYVINELRGLKRLEIGAQCWDSWLYFALDCSKIHP